MVHVHIHPYSYNQTRNRKRIQGVLSTIYAILSHSRVTIASGHNLSKALLFL